MNLLLTARRKDRLDEMAATLSSRHGVQIQTLELDLNAPGFLTDLLDAAADKDIGLVVSNAGLGFKGLHHEQTADQFDPLINVNVRAPTLITNAFAPQLIARGKGGIVITGSVEGFISSPWSAAYAASKAYVHSLGEALWGELGHLGVDVLVLAPGATDTENLKLQGFDAAQMPNIMSPREVAELALANIRKGPIFVPGRLNKVMTHVLGLIPKRTRIMLVGKGTKTAMDKAAKGK
jgi:short-subunit dehydrogenase